MTDSGPPGAPRLDRTRTIAEGVGLRGQITLALVAALATSMALLAFAVDRVATRALVRERRIAVEAAAGLFAASLSEVTCEADVATRFEALRAAGSSIVGVEVRAADGQVMVAGSATEGVPTEARGANGLVRVWARHPASDVARQLTWWTLASSGISALAVLVFAYSLLTRLIVRPAENLERVASRMARTTSNELATIEGARELASLAITLNRVVGELRTDRRLLEQRLSELERTLRELESARASLVRSEKLATVGRLAAGIAHEIGNPLTGIMGFAQLLQSGGLSADDEAEFLRRIESETERIHRILRGLLDYARVPSAPGSEGARTSMEAVLAEALALCRPKLEGRDVEVARSIEPPGVRVVMDADGLTQVLVNLLLNAADALEGCAAPKLWIRARAVGSRVTLEVEDNGIGLAPELLPTLFEPFVTTKPPGRGTGLGLAVCQTLVESAGGTLRAEPGASGARFVVELARAVEADEPAK